jgi:RNA polymerase sigma factor (sigma-70 family)
MSSTKYTQNERKVRLLEEQIKTFKQAIKACEEIIDGHTETSVLEKYNIDRRYFRQILFEPKLGFDYKAVPLPPSVDEDSYSTYWKHKWKDYCWEEQLFCCVFREYNINNVPTHLEYVLPVVLDSLSYREKEVLVMYYMQGMTMEEIGKAYGVTNNRIKQIKDKAERKLRHPSRANLLLYGPDYAEETEKIREEDGNRRAECKNKIDKLRADMNYAINNGFTRDLLNIRAQIDSLVDDEDVSSNIKTDPYYYYISNMNLSVRTYNAISRGGYKSVLDFKGKTVQEILRLRNMGRKSFDELATKLSEYGIYLIDEETKMKYVPPKGV